MTAGSSYQGVLLGGRESSELLDYPINRALGTQDIARQPKVHLPDGVAQASANKVDSI